MLVPLLYLHSGCDIIFLSQLLKENAMSSTYKKFAPAGPGGRTCACCYPQTGKGKADAKRQDERKARRAFTSLLRKGAYD